MSGTPKRSSFLVRGRRGPATRTALTLALTCSGVPVYAQAPDTRPFYPAELDAPGLARRVDEHLAAGRAAIERLTAVTGRRTAANTLQPYDDAQNHAFQAGGLAGLAIHVHPDSAVRAEGLRAQARVRQFEAGLRGDRRVVDAIGGLDTVALTAPERRLVAALQRGFRRAGHDLEETKQAQLSELRATTSRLGTVFARNIAEDTTAIPATRAELEGMPPDWIAAHPLDLQGRVLLSTRYPDFFPVIAYSGHRPLRQRMLVAFGNRGWPANVAVLDSLLHAREAIARLLGYPDWVSYVAETRMAGSADTIRAFLHRVHEAASPALERLAAEYLARLRQDDPAAASVDMADHSYLAELIRRERYALDGREVRAYFPVDAVKDGLLGAMAEMFGLDFRPAAVPVWHPDVEAWEAWEGDRLLGRFYLDLYPRPAKYSHAAVMTLRPGLPGRQTAEVMLVTNFPRAEDGGPGLMGHTDPGSGVTTFFHEFGHVLHVLFVQQPYLATDWEHDFNEAPSQMLEELAWQPAVLQRVTRHVETGAPIPAELVARMRAADAFDRPTQAAMQLAFSAVSLGLHERPAAHANPDSLMNAVFSTYLSVTPAEHHFVTSIDHLGMGDYSATMYTYLWSQVISKDLWSAFDADHPLDPGPARRYRDAILRPGGTRPAAELLRDFLGRPFGFASWQRWLEGLANGTSREAAPAAVPGATAVAGNHLDVAGGRIWYQVAAGGSGTPVVLLHGGPGLSSVYLKGLDALGERAVVRYDQLGSGHSDAVKDTSLFTIAHYVEELDRLRTHLGLERIHVYGHSWGSILAYEYYRAHPARVASLVLASPVLDMRAFFDNYAELLAAISDATLRAAELRESGQPYDTAAFRAGMREFIGRHNQRAGPGPDADSLGMQANPLVAGHMMGSSILSPNGTLKDYDATPFLGDTRVPVLFLVGDSDFAGPDLARRFANLTPHARLVVIPDSGHMMTWDQPAAHLEAVRTFLREVDR